jgi:hypothetical protein
VSKKGRRPHLLAVLEVWARADGTTGNAVRWALGRIRTLEREVQSLATELDELKRDARIGEYLKITRAEASALAKTGTRADRDDEATG